MNDLVTRNNTAVATNEASNPFTEHADSASQRTIVGKLLKFSKGDWFAGQEEDEIEEGTTFIANMGEMLKGWQKWEDNKPTDQILGKVMERFQPPRRSELDAQNRDEWEVDSNGKERDPWQQTNYLLLQGADDHEHYTFTTSSKGGLDAMALLCRAYGPHMATKPKHWPIVAVGSGSYAHPNKEFGRIKFPTFKIVGWALKTDFKAVGEIADEGVDADDANIDELPEPEVPAKPQPKAAVKRNRI